MSIKADLQTRVETSLLRGALSLPEPVQRRLAGRPVVVDGQTLAPELQLMLRLQRVARLPGAETMPIPEGRRVIDHQSAMTGGTPPVGSVRSLDLDGVAGRLYTPSAALTGAGATPLLVFFHGGGFIYGGLDSHDATCRVLAEQAGVKVLAVDYRLAPEAPFPAAYDDSLAAFRWALAHADELGADPTRVAVGGDSAGGNLAAAVAVAAAREGRPLAFQLLVYPATDNADRATRSYELFREGFFLTTRFMELATESYTPDAASRLDPRVSPLRGDVPDGLAPAYVATAGFDPLRDEGEAYARRLADAGVGVELKRFPDLIHGFFNIIVAGRRSRAAVDEIAAALKAGLA
ncbi:alpha/beta hydrolase [Nocardioides sp. C4-1]|uniref:alpha/beta hydrolase n=1 Tax=Nocardioides sp. C4-1 TaxID=3151851 RepID=UPI003262FE0F